MKVLKAWSVAKYMEAMEVQRYHTRSLIKGETVGHHSACAAWLAGQLWLDIHGTQPSSFLLMAVLEHDAPELVTGDVPATAKWRSSELTRALQSLEVGVEKDFGFVANSELSGDEKEILKMADILQLCFKAVGEIHMGNRNMIEILSNGLNFVEEKWPNWQTIGTSLFTELVGNFKGILENERSK